MMCCPRQRCATTFPHPLSSNSKFEKKKADGRSHLIEGCFWIMVIERVKVQGSNMGGNPLVRERYRLPTVCELVSNFP